MVDVRFESRRWRLRRLLANIPAKPVGTGTDPCESSGLSSQEFAVEATSMPMSGQIALACSVNHSDCIQIVTRLYDHAQAVNAVVDANGGSVVPLRLSNPVSRMAN